MVTLSSAKIVRNLASDRKLILDAGCGSGVLALHLAKQNTNSVVHGYDISPDEIEKAEMCRKLRFTLYRRISYGYSSRTEGRLSS